MATKTFNDVHRKKKGGFQIVATPGGDYKKLEKKVASSRWCSNCCVPISSQCIIFFIFNCNILNYDLFQFTIVNYKFGKKKFSEYVNPSATAVWTHFWPPSAQYWTTTINTATRCPFKPSASSGQKADGQLERAAIKPNPLNGNLLSLSHL